MYWRTGPGYRKQTPRTNKTIFHGVVRRGPPPGLLAFYGSLAVGWCQLTPRDVLPWLDRVAQLPCLDGIPVWSISCFYIRKGYRRRGVTSALLKHAINVAQKAGAPALEAYPLDPEWTQSTSFTGYSSTFLRAGFKVVARHIAARPIMRIDFVSPRAALKNSRKKSR
jgi:GNAT superfamily N-acetyltransferase